MHLGSGSRRRVIVGIFENAAHCALSCQYVVAATNFGVARYRLSPGSANSGISRLFDIPPSLASSSQIFVSLDPQPTARHSRKWIRPPEEVLAQTAAYLPMYFAFADMLASTRTFLAIMTAITVFVSSLLPPRTCFISTQAFGSPRIIVQPCPRKSSTRGEQRCPGSTSVPSSVAMA